jgi:hypothetical protein
VSGELFVEVREATSDKRLRFAVEARQGKLALICSEKREAPPGFESGIEVLQSDPGALPLSPDGMIASELEDVQADLPNVSSRRSRGGLG